MTITVHPFFEASSGSYSFVVANPESRCCAFIDPALGVAADGEILNTDCADLMVDWANAHQFVVRWILETHVHADRPSAAGYLKSQLVCAQTGIGADTPEIGGYDHLLQDGDKICLDHECGRVLATPGHTPGCVSYQFGEFVFIGDTLFMPDTGTARCDFPGGCATTLFHSIERILALPDDTRLFVCHDYGGTSADGKGRRNRFVTTVAEQKQNNIHVGAGLGLADFVQMRAARDNGLAAPKWQDFSIPANLQCMGLRAVQSLVEHTAVQEVANGRH